MAEPIGPGDFVECIDATSGVGVWLPGEEIRVGCIYSVSEVFIGGDGEPALDLNEVKRSAFSHEYHGFRVGYAARRFRPIYRPRASLIESLKAPPKRAARKLVEV